jgi:probable F420-dependent oxidoreductase
MHIGVVLPQTELGADRDTLRNYASAVEEFGFHHILAFDHVLGADPEIHTPWTGPYDVDTTFHEPFVVFGYLAAICSLELVTGVIILPQRQTALVAKQAVEVDLLTNGRFRLGVGLGWNAVEYEALGKNFHDRGRRVGEQVQLLRRLTSERSVRFKGVHETINGAGLAPLPVQRPIPIWIGGNSTTALRRIGRLADGWFPQRRPGEGLEDAKTVVEESAVLAGKDPKAIGMEGQVAIDPADPDELLRSVTAWERAGASHVSINTMRLGFSGVDAHLEALQKAALSIGLTR